MYGALKSLKLKVLEFLFCFVSKPGKLVGWVRGPGK